MPRAGAEAGICRVIARWRHGRQRQIPRPPPMITIMRFLSRLTSLHTRFFAAERLRATMLEASLAFATPLFQH